VKRTVSAVAIAGVIALASCSSDTPAPAASKATSFAAGACNAISAWGNDIVDAANAFTDETSHLSNSGRRSLYLFAFDEQERITEQLRQELEAAPAAGLMDADAVRAELLHAVDDVVKNIHDQKADAAANVDFTTIGPKPDRLFAGTEKSLSLMLKPLDQTARDHNVDALGGSCGR
jgi:hypothetical protein